MRIFFLTDSKLIKFYETIALFIENTSMQNKNKTVQ